MPFMDSDPVVTTLGIQGVWIHDPDDPEGTLRQFVYGANQRGDSFDSMGSGTYYVGRESPVVDFGDPAAFSVDITIDVPHGPDYTENVNLLRAYAAVKKSLWFRDNRSRAVYGWMSSFKVTDQGWGSVVSFTVTQSHRVFELVTS
jgi:hypothetical protein